MDTDAATNGTTPEAVKPLDLPTLLVPVTKLRPNPWNPNKMSEAITQAERESIRRFGFIDPITVMPDWEAAAGDSYVIIDGEHRWRIAKEPDLPHRQGYTQLPVVVLDISVEDAKRLTIVLNETRGDADVVLLGKLLTELQQAASGPDDFRDALPYTAAELDHFLSLGAVDWDQFEPGEPTPPAAPPTPHTLELAFASDQDLARFKEHVEIVRREGELGDDASVTSIVAGTVAAAALAANRA